MKLDQSMPSHKPGVLHYDVLDEMVVYCPDSMQAASLNESARAIWELCDGTRTIEDICTELASQVGLPKEQLQDDVNSVIDRLRQLDFLRDNAA